MITTQRFDNAIEKLYSAFHQGNLVPECCNRCAVGNICDNTDFWKHLADRHGSTVLSYVGRVNETFGRRINGYRPSELLEIEAAFLKGCGYTLPLAPSSDKPAQATSKDTLFAGLCAVISLLCKMDGLPDIMDCESLLDFQPSGKDMSLAS